LNLPELTSMDIIRVLDRNSIQPTTVEKCTRLENASQTASYNHKREDTGGYYNFQPVT
jgi:hypothetical protein